MSGIGALRRARVRAKRGARCFGPCRGIESAQHAAVGAGRQHRERRPQRVPAPAGILSADAGDAAIFEHRRVNGHLTEFRALRDGVFEQDLIELAARQHAQLAGNRQRHTARRHDVERR
jgi:hypothetical protein